MFTPIKAHHLGVEIDFQHVSSEDSVVKAQHFEGSGPLQSIHIRPMVAAMGHPASFFAPAGSQFGAYFTTSGSLPFEC